ncbi:hypothetical protein CCO02nite_20590 [Cellulomonas composti]|uniref:Uncharacterized protein n=1 Tax=Cellulomonas composti TaxID=266130 RepID=A0A511JBN0_9CELL|nr:hypothetical protein CCO02nite_20590 [Cellulomonas composti]
MDEFELLARLGVAVVEVEGMTHPVCYVSTQNVGLLRAGLDAERRLAAGALLLDLALRQFAAHQGP